MVIRVVGKSTLLAVLVAVWWGAFYYVVSGGSVDHATFPAIFMFVIATIGGTLLVLGLYRSPRRQLWLITGRLRSPRPNLLIVIALLWGTGQGTVVAWGTHSAGRGIAAGLVIGSMFLWVPPLGWQLFRRELTSQS